MYRAGLLGFTLLTACASHSNHAVRPLRPLELATAPYDENVTASMTGSLLYEGGCLLFRDDQTKARLLPVWPTGSIFNGTAVIFHQPGKADQPILVGEETVLEGQPVEWSALPPTAFASFQRQCVAPPFYVSRVRPAD
jgi:hypothetical protein